MISKQMRKIKLGILLLIVTAMFGGCAEERDPVDRVQPYAIDKSYFIGESFTDTRDDPEFWGRNSMVDVGYGAAQGLMFTATIGQQVARMKWQITEDYLIGRSTYERISGSDGKGAAKVDKYGTAVGSKTNDGLITCMFRIEKHFDIVKSYNPTTGEKINVVEENSWDRPWYERQYMRVDWSRNTNTDSYDFDTLSLAGVYGGTLYEPVSYFVEDPNDDDAPFFDLEAGYFDITTKAFAKPQLIDLSHLGWGINSFPACMLPNDLFGGTSPSGSCSPVELTLRHSFRRVVDNDFQPRAYDGPRFTSYGGFFTQRYGYSQNYRIVDKQWYRMLNHYQIWERSHYYEDYEAMDGWIPCNTYDDEHPNDQAYTTTPYGSDPNRDMNGNGTADECEEVSNRLDQDGNAVTGGSQCDTFKHRCTLPFQSRKAKPMAWYYTTNGDMTFYEPTDRATNDWDVALRSAVQTAKYAECVHIGTLEEIDTKASPEDQKTEWAKEVSAVRVDCQEEFPVWHGQQDDNIDAIRLAYEVDACRAGTAYEGETECDSVAEKVGADRGYSEDVIKTAKMDEMVVLCHSPVHFTDHELCGYPRLPEGMDAETCLVARNLVEEGDIDPVSEFSTLYESVLDADNEVNSLDELVTACQSAIAARAGDLRYHQVNSIVTPQTPSPWGIMVSAVDPESGETFATSANVWTWVNYYWSQLLVDQVRLIKGELTPADITEAEHVSDWAAAAEASSYGGAAGTMTKRQLNLKISNIVADRPDPEFLKRLEDMSPETQKMIKDMQASLPLIAESATLGYTNDAIYQARRRSAQGTEFEAELMTPAVKQLYGVDGLSMGDSIMDLASPLRGGNPSIQRDFEMMLQNNLHKRNTCILNADFGAQAPMSYSPIADIMDAKFGPFNANDSAQVQQERAEKMRKYIALNVHYAVVVHEMGHSISHRHNFVSSSDAWSYRPQYWQLRTKNGTVNDVDSCEGELSDSDGEDCVGPRYFDPVTKNERDNMIWMWQHSSVMDYAGEPSQDFLGLGAYDFAATRMFYGDVVAVHKDSSYKSGTDRANGVVAKMSLGFGGTLGIQHYIGAERIHYSKLQMHHELIVPGTCKAVSVEDFVPDNWDADVSGKFHPVLDAWIVDAGDGLGYSRCRQQPVDWVRWSDLRLPFGEENPPQAFYNFPKYDREDRVLVPYGFATDEWADIGNVSVYRHDNGADSFEIFNFLITQKKVSYIFDNFRRSRSDFSVRSAAARGLSRFNTKVRDGAKGLGMYKTMIRDGATAAGYSPDSMWEQYAASGMLTNNLVAAALVFDHFTSEISRPQDGRHGKYGKTELMMAEDRPGNMQNALEYKLSIPTGATGNFGMVAGGGGRLENRLAKNLGDYERDYTMNCGTYYDKMYAAMLFTESTDRFIAQATQDFYDTRFRAISLADVFPEGYRRMLGTMLTGDELRKGSWLAVDEDGNVETDSFGYPVTPIGWTSWWQADTQPCFPSSGTQLCEDPGAYSDPDVEHPFHPEYPAYWAPVDAQVGWDLQKFLIAWTMLYLPENQLGHWMNSLRIWEMGLDADPGFPNRIELHNPNGKIYIAKTSGRETLFPGTHWEKEVQKGIAARVLEWANELLNQAYETNEVDIDDDGKVDWYEPIYSQKTGLAMVKLDSNITVTSDKDVDSEMCNEETQIGCCVEAVIGDDEDEEPQIYNEGCECGDNHACMELNKYVTVPRYLRQAMDAYGLSDPEPKGIYD
jgi:hypothetical protein